MDLNVAQLKCRGILGEDEMSTGRRGQEVKGVVFRDSPIVPPKDAGTLVGNIILIPFVMCMVS